MAPKDATNSDSSSTLQRACAARKAGMMRRGVPTNSTRSCQGATIQREEGGRLCAVAPDETDRITIVIGREKRGADVPPPTADDQRGAHSARRVFLCVLCGLRVMSSRAPSGASLPNYYRAAPLSRPENRGRRLVV